MRVTVRVTVLATLVAGTSLAVSPASAVVGASLFGEVRGADGAVPSTHTRVTLQRFADGQWRPLEGDLGSGYAYTDYYGRYRIDGVPAGSYRVEFDQMDHLVQHQEVVLVDGEERRLDAVLDRGAAITGRVLAPAGTSFENGFVRVFAWHQAGPNGWWQQVDSAYVDPSGTYSASGFGAGTYRVGLVFTDGAFPTEYYDNAADVEGAKDLTVAAGGTLAGIDFDLATTPVATPPATKPSVTFGPRARLGGKARVGRMLKVRGLRVRPRGATVSYRWSVGGTKVRRARKARLRLRPAMAGKRVKVTVVARIPGHAKARTVLRSRTRVRRR